MQRVSFILGALALTVCVLVNEVDAIVCKDGGTCIQKNEEECTSCSCLTGFTGSDCGTILMKVTGLVSYNTSGAGASNVSKTGFKNRLKFIFPHYRSSTVDVKNSKSFTMASFVVYVQRPVVESSFDVKVYQSDSQAKLVEQATTDAAFSNSVGISVSSASTDVDECASDLFSCMENADCYNTASGYGCTCKVGFIENNGTSCTEVYCLLSKAPTWPSSATRTVTYPNGTIASNLGKNVKMPYKTFISYKCSERHSLVNEVTGKAQTDVIECVGNREPTHKNSGWTGSNVRCDMIIEFTVAIIMAVVSSAIIVLVGGAFVVSCTKKKPAEDDTDTVVLEMDNGIMPGHIPR